MKSIMLILDTLKLIKIKNLPIKLIVSHFPSLYLKFTSDIEII